MPTTTATPSGSDRDSRHPIAVHAEDTWVAVRLLCAPDDLDTVSALLFEAGCGGIEERTGADGVTITASFPPEEVEPLRSRITAILDEVRARTGVLPARILDITPIPPNDWEFSWRAGLGSVESGKRLVVRPSWIPYDNADGRIEVIIDPKMAFGSGGHATTHLCLEALETMNIEGLRVIDAGCGSGVLSIAAAKLGAREVDGFDNDPFSVANARENALANGVADRVIIREADLESISLPPADLVLANLISGVIIAYLPVLHRFLAPGGTILFSGLLASEESLIVEALAAGGFTPGPIAHHDEWIALPAKAK